MATTDVENKTTGKPVCLNLVDGPANPVKKIALQTEDDTESSEHSTSDVFLPPFFSYSRSQILVLHKSPLVRCPEGMPELKDWFGDWNEPPATKKDPDNSAASSNNRDRRFRRDPEDSESTTARPSFRTSLTQPSQMGNFRHQSTRTSDRDRDKDVDKDKDRDKDTKDGQDRLRSLSDKFDRDRLGLASSSTTIRRDRERDAAPHLTNATSTRLSGQTPLPAGSRRAEVRDTAKRRNGESSDDWRRGAEPPRLSRDEKSDGYRRDRETREQPRSRVRESSRSRRDTSSSRRDRDDKDKDRERYREREDRGERPTRGMDHYSPPRDKEFSEDPRRWRDDGKREERLAARRERDRDARERDKPLVDNERDTLNDRSRDKDRWHTTDERDNRLKRSSARDRRYAEDGKDEPRDKERERDKEKEPAWMETYIPSDSHGGILGGQSADGELDSIQAWKKGMKEKEKDKQVAVSETKEILDSSASASHQQENQMDEIQLFKMLIKREADKKEVDKQPSSATSLVDSLSNDSTTPVNHEQHFNPPLSEETLETQAGFQNTALSPVAQPAVGSPVTGDDSHSLLPLITSSSGEPGSSSLASAGKLSAVSLDSQKSSGSRFFPNLVQGDSSIVSQKAEKFHAERVSSSPASEYNPPQSSRLLALGSRTPSGSSTHSSKPQSSTTPTNISPVPPHHTTQLHGLQAQAQPDLVQSPDVQFRLQPEHSFGSNQRPSSVRQQEHFSPFNHVGRGTSFEEKDLYTQQYDGHRRTSGVSSVSSDSGMYNDASNNNGGFIGNGGQTSTFDLTTPGNQAGSYSSGKGSRFAKFFDNKGRDSSAAMITKSTGRPSPSPLQGHRQDVNRIHVENQADPRTMEDIFAMLQSSAQGQRISQPSQLGQTSMFGSNSFGPGMSLQPQHVQQHGPVQSNGRLDALYDSRFDDKSFMPDGMVPGLRSVPQTRSRDIGNGYIPDNLDEQIPFGVNRHPPQHRNGDMFNNNGPQIYPHQQGFVRSAPLQQPYRGNPSPIASQNPLQTLPQQRLPPGLANLGGRPPHDSTQFFGNTMSLQSAPQGIVNNGISQPVFSNFQPGSLSFPSGPQMRASSNPHHMQSIAGHSPLVGLGHANNIEVRGPSQAQLLGLRGGYGSQQLAHAQLQAQQLGLRQQQQQHLIPPHMVPHALPQHDVSRGHDQAAAHDLMALLMGNNASHRE